MDFTANKPLNQREPNTHYTNRKYSIHAQSPTRNYESPSIQKSLFPSTTLKQNPPLFTHRDPLLRSPIDPLVASSPSEEGREGREKERELVERMEREREHRVEVEALLMEVATLRGMLMQSSEQQAQELIRLRQGYEESNFLQMSSFRQKEQSQVEVYEFQIRKLKEQMAERVEEQKKLEIQLQRERKSHQQEKDTLKQEVRLLIDKKNAEILDLKQELEERVRKVIGEKEQEIGDLKYSCTREINAINKILENKTREVEQLASVGADNEAERQRLLERAQAEREEVERRYEQRMADQDLKYQNLKENFNKLVIETTQLEEDNWQQLQQMFNQEYASLFNLLKHKDAENAQLRRQLELVQANSREEIEAAHQEAQLARERLKEQAAQWQQEVELLKVKVAALHQSDLEKVKQLYELRLQHAAEGRERVESENAKLREMMQTVSSQRYEMKQRYDVIVSELQAKLLKMRMGMHSLQSDFRQKLQNEKSLMLMTSRSFLKEAEVKSHNNKFLEEEIRKLRQLMDLQTRQNENAERAVEEKIMAANNQLERLSSRVVNIAQEKKELEEAIEALRKDKDREIARLKNQIVQLQKPRVAETSEEKLIEELKEERNNLLQEIGKLKDKLAALESRMREMRAEVERANMEAQINHEEGRKQYHEIAESHLSEFKKFYEEKLKRVEEEKEELKKIINSQYEQITELIKKYKQLQEGMKDAVALMKKRTVLEEKVMNIGMDNNLVKNLAQLLPSFSQQ